MKSKITTAILIVSTLTALASVAAAQTVLPSPAPTAPVMPPSPVVPPQPVRPPPTISAGAAAGASSGAAGTVNSPVMRPDAGAAVDSQGRAGVGATVAPGRVDANAAGRSSTDTRANGLPGQTMVTGESSASLRTDETVRAIQSTSYATRDQVTANVQSRIDATNNLVAELRLRAEVSGDRSKAAFAKALAAVRQREQAVRASLRATARVTGESTWGAAQSQLAQDYGAYAKAVAEAEVAARATTDVSGQR